MHTNIKCPACARISSFKIHSSSKFSQCKNCNGWTAINYKTESLDEIYNKNYFDGGEYLNYNLGLKIHEKNYYRKIKIINRYNYQSKLKLLEIGSATGSFLNFCNVIGITNSIGIEVSQYGLDICKGNNLNVISPFDPNLTEIIKKFEPNIICAWDVWEHLNNPAEVFSNYMNLLAKNSIIALTTVDSNSLNARLRQAKWRQFHPPTHLVYPTRKSFLHFFEDQGFEIVYHKNFGYFRPLSEYLSAVFGKSDYLKNSKILFKIPFYLNLYDTQMVIARKK